ncbi:MAG: 2-amino-4-hydroxy-6-hydroxymethyldihydropteridine diphosphokinase [Calditrichia bacterium]|nr:2-amino-4-hydroxy-6-hydroxymethyldihydropteridine diphosphokinase [Calditrichia bacterium]
MPWSFIGIGSNLGDRLENIQKAVQLINAEYKILSAASIYETPPYGYTDQSSFYNTVVKIETSHSSHELLENLMKIEKNMGRIRKKKWGPRNIDLDIIFYENEKSHTSKLKIPHPDYKNRAFVLIPLAEIMSGFIPPDDDRNINKILSDAQFDVKINKAAGQWMKL